MAKERLDVILVRLGLAASREKAKEAVLAGNVFVDGRRADKAGTAMEAECVRIEVRGAAPGYVSRGGLKLEKAVEVFALSLEGKICVDIGASTGGFTDCMLQNGAARVYSVDVGHGQLDPKLREDDRVVCMEGVNFRYMSAEDIGERPDFVSADVSFISLTKILLPARAVLCDGGRIVCLVKPQFEAGREKVGKKGVVRERSVHREVLCKVLDYADSIGFRILGLDFSPVRGPEGNIEYLLFLQKDTGYRADTARWTEREAEENLRRLTEEKSGCSCREPWKMRIAEVVENAHRALE